MVQGTRWIVMAMALAVAGRVAGLDEPDTLVAAKLVSVKPGTLFRLVAKGSFPLPAPANAPTAAGASLTVFDTAFPGAGTASFDLPAGGWKSLGVAAGTTGYRYRGGPGDPCRSVLLKQGYIKAVCRGAAVTLAPPFVGDVGVVLTAGSDSKRYCAQAGGQGTNSASLVRRKNAPAPAVCPAPHLGAQTCALDTATTRIGFATQAFGLDFTVSGGALQLTCGPELPGGQADCDCAIASIPPIYVPAIGDVCIDSAPGCASGTLDCDGGNARDTDVVADHDIGACTGNAACGADCADYCSGLGAAYTATDSGCQGFCRGGANDDAPCAADSDCPGGTCAGTDPPATPGICHCECAGRDLGAASPAGTLACELGMELSLEFPGDGDCNDGPFFTSEPRCVPFTTATSTAVILDRNGAPGQTIPSGGPSVKVGVATSCQDFLAGDLTGMRLHGGLAVLSTALGDLLSHEQLVCQ
jgi:hypothetical protein